MAFKQCESEKNELMRTYLCVLLVTPVDFSQTLSSCFAGRRHCKSLLHFAGTITETSLDTIGFIKLIHLVGTRKMYWEKPQKTQHNKSNIMESFSLKENSAEPLYPMEGLRKWSCDSVTVCGKETQDKSNFHYKNLNRATVDASNSPSCPACL